VERHEQYFRFSTIIIAEHRNGIPLLLIMNINEAVIKRIQEICNENETSICDTTLKAGMSPSCIYDLLHKRTKHSKINTIQRFCEGAGITLEYFFSAVYFRNLEQED